MDIDKLIGEALSSRAGNFRVNEQKCDTMLDYIEKHTERNKGELLAAGTNSSNPFVQRIYGAATVIARWIKCRNKHNSKHRVKISLHFSDFIQVTTVIAVLALVPILTLSYKDKYNKRNDNNIGKNTDGHNRLETSFLGSMGYVIITDTAMYRNADKNSEQIRKLKVGDLMLIKKIERGADNDYWYYAVDAISRSTDHEGWIPDIDGRRLLAITRVEESSIRNEDIKILMESYLKSLSMEHIPDHSRIREYKVNKVTLNLIQDLQENIKAVSATIEYDVKPYNVKGYKGLEVETVDSDGWIKGIYGSASVEIIDTNLPRVEEDRVQRLCILTNILSEPLMKADHTAEKPEPGIAVGNLLNKYGFISIAGVVQTNTNNACPIKNSAQ